MTDPTDSQQLPPPDPGTAISAASIGVRTPRKRRRIVIIAAIVVGLAAVGIGVLMMVDKTVLRHDLLEANFDVEAKPFRVGDTPEYRFELVSGTYRITSAAKPTNTAESFAWFRRYAYSVDISADVVAVSGLGPNTAVGISCADKPNANGHGYMFLVSATGSRVVRTDGTSPSVLMTSTESHDWSAAPTHLRLTCSPLPGNIIEVHGFVNGSEVIHASDPNGLEVFRSVELLLDAKEPNQSVTFDNVVAVVPEP